MVTKTSFWNWQNYALATVMLLLTGCFGGEIKPQSNVSGQVDYPTSYTANGEAVKYFCLAGECNQCHRDYDFNMTVSEKEAILNVTGDCLVYGANGCEESGGRCSYEVKGTVDQYRQFIKFTGANNGAMECYGDGWYKAKEAEITSLMCGFGQDIDLQVKNIGLLKK